MEQFLPRVSVFLLTRRRGSRTFLSDSLKLVFVERRGAQPASEPRCSVRFPDVLTVPSQARVACPEWICPCPASLLGRRGTVPVCTPACALFPRVSGHSQQHRFTALSRSTPHLQPCLSPPLRAVVSSPSLSPPLALPSRPLRLCFSLPQFLKLLLPKASYSWHVPKANRCCFYLHFRFHQHFPLAIEAFISFFFKA